MRRSSQAVERAVTSMPRFAHDFIKQFTAPAGAWPCSFVGGAAGRRTRPQPRLAALTLQAGMHNIRAEVARTPMQTQTGMMFRRRWARNDGMLFVFDQPERALLLDEEHAAAADHRLHRRRRQHRQPRRHAAAVGRVALLGAAGALCAGDEPGLVRQARHQARLQAEGRALRERAPRAGAAAAGSRSRPGNAARWLSRSCAARSPS